MSTGAPQEVKKIEVVEAVERPQGNPSKIQKPIRKLCPRFLFDRPASFSLLQIIGTLD
jgi:hypothetical protein